MTPHRPHVVLLDQARPAQRLRSRLPRTLLILALLAVTSSCSLIDVRERNLEDRAASGPHADTMGDDSGSPSGESSEATPWGPTADELTQARDEVAGFSSAQLAGQLIVGRYFSTDPAEAAALVSDLHLAGMAVTQDNVTDEAQVLATTAAIAQAHAADGRAWPAVIGVDEEGGSVAHLRGVATTFPAFQTDGVAIERDRVLGSRDGRRAVQQGAAAAGLELRSLGFTWVFAPVADVTIGQADPTIGTRSAGMDPRVAATATAAAVRGYQTAGIVCTPKHFPGHGSATSDSHDTLPTIDRPLAELERIDLLPFRTAVKNGASAIMLGHLDVPALESGLPSSLAPNVYDYLREQVGFEGVAITDSMGMGAVMVTPKPAVTAINAGADLVLMPANTRGTHATITAAIDSGEISLDRAREAASRVVALQLWQQRTAESTPVPPDAAAQAESAAAAIVDAASR